MFGIVARQQFAQNRLLNCARDADECVRNVDQRLIVVAAVNFHRAAGMKFQPLRRFVPAFAELVKAAQPAGKLVPLLQQAARIGGR